MPARIRYFDIAKGIAILCVVLGHSILIANTAIPQSPLAQTLYHLCFTFHMPLFFIVSGYFMHPERPFRWRKESRELLATYGLTAAAIVIVNAALAFVLRTGTRASFAGWAAAAYYGAGDMTGNYLWLVPFRIGALWFLLGLFWAHLIVHFAAKTPYPSLVILASFVIGYLSARIFWFPLSVQSGMTAAAFVYLGVLARRYDLLNVIRTRAWIWAIAALVWVIAIWQFAGFSMAMNQYGPSWWHVAISVCGAVAGTLCVLGISTLIDRFAEPLARLFQRFGKVSLAILCVHLLEDDTTPWGSLLPHPGPHPGGVGASMWIIIFVVRLAVDILLAWGLFHIPHVNALFFPYLEKRADKSAPVPPVTE
ncbi:MAG: acyltransferase family protein [Bifidobacterium scardovii]|uniref:acyltransferase family protein n=1 Tax=Bifidobacterium scardovii TaxID=158787 RepID=UPI0028FDEABB|nr:acyltransferase family protein [Bifidobacterium scardovii]MDU2421931.1 acyltransferase family protein [Bifidobacterium scardovii]